MAAKIVKPIEIIKPYVRNGNFPIDSTTFFTSYADAVEYAHNDLSAYPSQIIGVDDEEHRTTEIYKIDYDPAKVYRYVLAPIGTGGIGNASGTTMFNLLGSVDVLSKEEYPPRVGDDNVLVGKIKTTDTAIYNKTYYIFETYPIQSPNPEYLNTYFEYIYTRTKDITIDSTKTYYTYDPERSIYVVPANPTVDDISNYYELVLVKADTTNVAFVPTEDTYYVLNTTPDLVADIDYYEKDGDSYILVEEPEVEHAQEYYIVNKLDPNKKYYTANGREILHPTISELSSYYEKVFAENKQYYGQRYSEVISPRVSELDTYYEDGIIDNRSDLPDVANQGDMYFVKYDSTFYVAFENEDESISWAPLTLNVKYASISNDGIITKEMYKTFRNDTGKDAVYFSRNADTESNSWIEVAHTEGEGERPSYKLASEGRVKQMVTTLFGESSPYIVLTSDIDLNNPIGEVIHPTITLKYFQEFGGELNHVAAWKIIDGHIAEAPFFSTTPEYDDVHSISGVENAYEYSFRDDAGIYLNSAGTIQYKVVVDYSADSVGDVPAGSCEAYITFNFHDIAEYGTNLEVKTALLIPGEPITYSFNPREFNEGINMIYIKVPYSYYIDKIVYTPQNDVYAKDLFTTSLVPSQNPNYVLYKYELSGSIYFRTPAEYIFYPKHSSEQSII